MHSLSRENKGCRSESYETLKTVKLHRAHETSESGQFKEADWNGLVYLNLLKVACPAYCFPRISLIF